MLTYKPQGTAPEALVQDDELLEEKTLFLNHLLYPPDQSTRLPLGVTLNS